MTLNIILDVLANKDAGDKTKKKDKKEPFFIKYHEDVNFDIYFKETRAATTLSKSTLDKYSKSNTTLPEDLHYETDKLFRLFSKSKMMVSGHRIQLNFSWFPLGQEILENLGKWESIFHSGNFAKTVKVWKFYPKYWKNLKKKY